MYPIAPLSLPLERQTAEPKYNTMTELYYKLKWWLKTSLFPQPLFHHEFVITPRSPLAMPLLPQD
jgi:hypothetical protein